MPVTRLDASQHSVTRDRVDANALDVVTTLKEAGYEALLVGGCVRDLLLGATPKDFDVATNATPEDVRKLFRRTRLVGRRFRIAHVRYERDIIEVSTFRKSSSQLEEGDRHANADGMILRDNVYGTLDEDAFRRDFTINALYYDPQEEEILDFVGGLDDLDERVLRFIGDSRERLQEDPVRLLRAIRFQAKLGFSLDQSILDAANLASERLAAVPPARLFDEFTKLFLSGFATEAWSLVKDSPVRGSLFPATPAQNRFAELAMINTDQRIDEGRPITPGFLIAVLLWHDFEARIHDLETHHNLNDARLAAAQETLLSQREVIAIPRRYSQFANEVWLLQSRLEHRRGRQIKRILSHPRFRAAYDFLLLRAESELADPELARWWTRIQDLDSEGVQGMIDTLPRDARHKRRRRRRRSKSTS